MTSDILSTTPDSEIVTTRILHFTQELVYEAWSNPQHLKKLVGSKRFYEYF